MDDRTDDCTPGRTDNVVPLPVRRPQRAEAGPALEPEPLWREVLGDQLRATRTGGGERIVDVAGRAGISPQYLSELERGVKDQSSEILAAVSGALGLSVRELTWRAGRRLDRVARRSGDGPVCLAA